MLDLLKKNQFFYSKFNNILFKKGKKYNTEKLFNDFFIFSKKNKMRYNNITSLNKLFLKKIPFGSSRQKRFGKGYKEVPFFFSVSRGYKEIFKNILCTSSSSIGNKSNKISNSLLFKRFFYMLSSFNRRSLLSGSKETKFLRDGFNSLKISKSNYKLQW